MWAGCDGMCLKKISTVIHYYKIKQLLAGDDGDVKNSVTDIRKSEQDGDHFQDSVKVYNLNHP